MYIVVCLCQFKKGTISNLPLVKHLRTILVLFVCHLLLDSENIYPTRIRGKPHETVYMRNQHGQLQLIPLCRPNQYWRPEGFPKYQLNKHTQIPTEFHKKYKQILKTKCRMQLFSNREIQTANATEHPSLSDPIRIGRSRL